MKAKWMKKIAMLLAASIFMTQVPYFPAKTAEVSAEGSDETGTESESMAETVEESEVLISARLYGKARIKMWQR